jgi:protein-tyrosine phosphatase
VAERSLGLGGEPNARDVGGLCTADGRAVRRGRLFRSAALGRLTDDDVATLGKLGLSRVVDLRDTSEITLAPPDRLPVEPAPRVIALPVYDARHPIFTYVAAVLLGHDLEAYSSLAEQGTPAAMAAIYRWFVTDERAREGFGTVLRMLADPVQLPVLVHCTAGKDRTGWLTAVTLRILGVAREDILADYLATNHYAGPVYGTIIGAMRDLRPELDEHAVRPLFDARAEYLEAAYEEVDRVYGGFEAYLREGLRLDPATLAALRANLLG